MAMSAEHRSKFAAYYRQWWRLHMSEKFSNGTKTPKQTNKQTNSATLYLYYLHILGFYTWLDKHPGQSDLRDYRERMRTARSSRLQHSYYQGLKCKICPVLKKTPHYLLTEILYFNLPNVDVDVTEMK